MNLLTLFGLRRPEREATPEELEPIQTRMLATRLLADHCTHNTSTVTVRELPYPVGKIVEGKCKQCGLAFVEAFGPLIERRHLEGRATNWKQCGLVGFPAKYRTGCDCGYCSAARRARSGYYDDGGGGY